jgi:hypothetical protein
MTRWFAPFVLLLSLMAPAWADVGTCLRADGVQVAPFTDPVDPACGADCGPDDFNLNCTNDGLCRPDGDTVAPRLAMPAPTGPRCLESTADCEPYDPTATYAQAQGVAFVPLPFRLKPPRLGSLPGAGDPVSSHRPWARTASPETPPPRRG